GSRRQATRRQKQFFHPQPPAQAWMPPPQWQDQADLTRNLCLMLCSAPPASFAILLPPENSRSLTIFSARDAPDTPSRHSARPRLHPAVKRTAATLLQPASMSAAKESFPRVSVVSYWRFPRAPDCIPKADFLRLNQGSA